LWWETRPVHTDLSHRNSVYHARAAAGGPRSSLTGSGPRAHEPGPADAAGRCPHLACSPGRRPGSVGFGAKWAARTLELEAGLVPEIDTSRAHPARMYDYLLGGKDHFEADRQAIEALLQAVPNARTGARENRAFLGRAVQYLVAEAGIRQFLDIGSGPPTAHNVHEVAQSVAPDSRVVYVDNGRCKPGCTHGAEALAISPRSLRSLSPTRTGFSVRRRRSRATRSRPQGSRLCSAKQHDALSAPAAPARCRPAAKRRPGRCGGLPQYKGGYGADISRARSLHPALMTFETWLAVHDRTELEGLFDTTTVCR
jgi:hypothetical protein